MTDCFSPRHEVALAEGVSMEIYPPRILHRQGVSTSSRMGAKADFMWTSELGEVTVQSRVRRSGDRWDIVMSVANAGEDAEVAVRYPVVYYRFPEGTPVREFDPLFGGVLEKRSSWVERWYPGDASLCASFVTAPGQALGMAVRDEAQRRIRICHVPGDVSGQMGMELERVLVKRGEKIELPSAYIAWGQTWGDVLRPYRDHILATTKRAQPFCKWYWDGNWIENRYAHCLAPMLPTKATVSGAWSFDNARTPQTIEQLKKEMDEAFDIFDKRGLKPLFYQFGWWKAMATCRGLFLFDTVCGDYDEGGHPLIKPAIEYSHSKGGRTFIYTNFISAGEDTKVFRDHPEFFARDRAGFPVRNASYPMYMFCPSAPGLREYWDRVLRVILIDLDADGFFLDQVGGGTPNAYCYEPTHNHAHPDVYGRDYLALLDWVCRRAREIKPDCFIGGELTSDVRAMWCDQMQGVGYSKPREVTFASEQEAAATPPGEHFAFMSFINPEIAHLPSGSDYLARGCPGQPDNPLWKKYREVFRSGLQPCMTDPIGAMAYLFGPVNGEAILATIAVAELKDVTVELPMEMAPAGGGTHVARAVGDKKVVVEAGKEPHFYRFVEDISHESPRTCRKGNGGDE